MKNKLALIIIVAFSLSINAQIYTPVGGIQGTSINNNVGIGTNNTVAKLTIQAGPNNYPTPLKAISIWGPNSPADSNSAQDLSWDFAAAGSTIIRSYRGSNWDTYLQFMTNSNVGGNAPQVRMHISESGNVGVGTTNPQQKFVVSNNGAEGFELYFNQPSNVVGLQSYNRSSNVYSKMQLDASQFSFMYGNVGIGISNPSNKLDVKGTIHSQEVKVDMNDWSDFVFKKEYNLPTLEEVEKQIAEKGHLKNIPSEKEVLENGINLGEMNAKLLQKIEEMTLYMIEMKKDINILKEENKVLKANK